MRERSESAFAALVQRHVNLVYGSALRQAREPELARDITQAVFLVLSRTAATLRPEVILSGWLFRTTCHVASRAVRTEQRRLRRETEVTLMNSTDPAAEAKILWRELEPEIDSALAALSEQDRNALVVRFLEGKAFRTVGEQLGISEEAAKKRVARALQKLRTLLGARGIRATTLGVGAALLEANSVGAPPDLSEAIAHSARTGFPAGALQLAQEGLRYAGAGQWLALAAGLAVCGLAWAYWFTDRAAPVEKRVALQASPAAATPEQALPTPRPEPSAAVPGPATLMLVIRATEDNHPLDAPLHVSVRDKTDITSAADFRTDPQGIVSIPVNGGEIVILDAWLSAPGRVPLVLRWRGHEFVQPFIQHIVGMARGQVLEGVVRNESGEPVEAAQISFNNPGSNTGERENVGFSDRTSAVFTDKEGRFRSDHLPAPLGDHAFDYVVNHPDYIREVIHLAGLDTFKTNHVIILKRGLKISGKVLDEFGNPVNGATVTEARYYPGPPKKALADAFGEFVLGPFAPGSLRLAADATGFLPCEKKISSVEEATNVVLKLMAASQSQPWEKPWTSKPVRIYGTVRDEETGQPIARFTVRRYEPPFIGNQLVGEAHNGQFDWPVELSPDARFALEIQAEGYQAVQSKMRSVKDEPSPFALTLRRMTAITARVITSDGSPVVGALVALNGRRYGTSLQGGVAYSGNESPQTSTDANGRFSLPSRSEGESVLVANERGAIQVPLDHWQDTIVLPPWGEIRGRLIVNGKPRAGQQIGLMTAPPENPADPPNVAVEANAQTDADGRFEFTKIPLGVFNVFRVFNFNRDGPGPVGMNNYHRVTVRPGATTEVALHGNGRLLTGQLSLSRDIPGHDWRDDLQSLAPAELSSQLPVHPWNFDSRQAMFERQIFEEGLNRYYLSIAPDGSFSVEDVAPGRYILNLAVGDPKDPARADHEYNRREQSKLAVPVIVPAGEDSSLNLGKITIPVE